MCSAHFDGNDYHRSLKCELLHCDPLNGLPLKPDAVPHLNLPQTSGTYVYHRNHIAVIIVAFFSYITYKTATREQDAVRQQMHEKRERKRIISTLVRDEPPCSTPENSAVQEDCAPVLDQRVVLQL